MYAPKTMTQAPVARPSRPSVRLTPLEAPVMRRLDHRRNSRAPSTGPAKARSSLVSRTNEIAVDAGARPFPSVVHRASATKTTVTSVCPASFCRDVRPRLRSARILVKSSRKPTTPSPTRRKRTSRALTETGSPVTPAKPPASTAIRMPCERQVADQRRRDDHGATHGGLAALDVVQGQVVVDRLPVAAAEQEPDERRCPEQRHEHGDPTGEHHVDHLTLLDTTSGMVGRLLVAGPGGRGGRTGPAPSASDLHHPGQAP